MIEFKGKITGESLRFIANKNKKLFSFALIISGLMVCLLYRSYQLFIPVCFIIFVLLLCPVKAYAFLAPHRVYIDLNDRMIVSEIRGYPETFRMIDDIVEVKDHGEFYTFKFTSLRNQLNFIAQKNLITQGTIDEFEEIFEEVLVSVESNSAITS